MNVQKVWINERSGESTSINELRIDFDNDYHIAVDLQNNIYGGKISAEELIHRLLSSMSDVRSIIDRERSSVCGRDMKNHT